MEIDTDRKAIIVENTEDFRLLFQKFYYPHKTGTYIRLHLTDKKKPMFYERTWKEEDFWEMINALKDFKLFER